MAGPRPLVFVPTYNEKENATRLISEITSLGVDVDILFLDDNSPDGTGEILDRLASKNPGLHVIHRPGKAGIGSAHLAGLRWAYDHGYEKLVTMDCDFTHPPRYIPEMLKLSDEFAEVVGSRWLKKKSLHGWNAYRKVLTIIGHSLTRVLLGMPYDATGAYRLYRLDKIPRALFELVESRSYSFFFESLFLLHFNSFPIKEMAITLPARTYGHSKMSLRDAARSVGCLLKMARTSWLNPGRLRPKNPRNAPIMTGRGGNSAEWDEYWVAKKRNAGGALFDIIAAFYRRFIIKKALNHFMGRHFKPASQMLHAGCGSGQVDVDVSRIMRVSALDISPGALELYRIANGDRVALMHGSIFDIPLDEGRMDGVYNLGVMEHFTEAEIELALREFRRVLKSGGKVMFFWPPSFGLSVLVLDSVHFLLNRILGMRVKLHPDEVTRVRSKEHVRGLLERGGFRLIQYYFGPKDLFTHAIVVAVKESPRTTAG